MLKIGNSYLCKKTLKYDNTIIFKIDETYVLEEVVRLENIFGEYRIKYVLSNRKKIITQDLLNMNKDSRYYFFDYFSDIKEARNIKLKKINSIN